MSSGLITGSDVFPVISINRIYGTHIPHPDPQLVARARASKSRPTSPATSNSRENRT